MQRAGERMAELIQNLHLHAGARCASASKHWSQVVSPRSIRNVLWLGLQFSTASTHAYNAAVFSKLHHLHRSQPTKSTSLPISPSLISRLHLFLGEPTLMINSAYTSLYLRIHSSKSSILPWIFLETAAAVSGIQRASSCYNFVLAPSFSTAPAQL